MLLYAYTSLPCCPTGSLVNVLPVLLFFPLAFLGGLSVLILRKQTVTSELKHRSVLIQ